MKLSLTNLLSRKFLLAVGTVVTLVSAKLYDQAVAVALAYIGVQTGIDVHAAVLDAKTHVDAVASDPSLLPLP